MKQFLYLFTALIITNNLFSNSRLIVSNVIELKNGLQTFLREQHHNPKDLGYERIKIYLKRGWYQIEDQDSWFKDILRYYQVRKQFKAFQTQAVVYGLPRRNKRDTLFSATLGRTIKWFDQQLMSGIKVSGEVRYVLNYQEQLPIVLKKISENNSDTVIKMMFCQKTNCIHDFKVLYELQKLKMYFPDHMNLRIESRYFALEKDKKRYYDEYFYPFVRWEQFNSELKKQTSPPVLE